VFERFSAETIRIFEWANLESAIHELRFVGTEHILIGILQHDQNYAAKALYSLGVTASEVRRHAQELCNYQATPTENSAFTVRAKRTIELSLKEADEMGSETVQPEHLLLALICEGRGVASAVLEAMGVDLALIRPTLRTEIRKGG
jgi:ATP-dependent Clp protease ATP-binding subunit ClpC